MAPPENEGDPEWNAWKAQKERQVARHRLDQIFKRLSDLSERNRDALRWRTEDDTERRKLQAEKRELLRQLGPTPEDIRKAEHADAERWREFQAKQRERAKKGGEALAEVNYPDKEKQDQRFEHLVDKVGMTGVDARKELEKEFHNVLALDTLRRRLRKRRHKRESQ